MVVTRIVPKGHPSDMSMQELNFRLHSIENTFWPTQRAKADAGSQLKIVITKSPIICIQCVNN